MKNKAPAILLALVGIPAAVWLGARTGDAIRGNSANVYTDPATGCQYLVSRGSSEALTPRLDGKNQMGCRND